MATLTYRVLVDALEALSVSGVTRAYTQGPPGSLNSADLPASFVQMPAGDEDPVARGSGSHWPTIRADLVVAYEAAGQNLYPVNFDAGVDLLDSLATALRGLDVGKVAPSWTARLGIVRVAGNDYWAIVAQVEAQG